MYLKLHLPTQAHRMPGSLGQQWGQNLLLDRAPAWG